MSRMSAPLQADLIEALWELAGREMREEGLRGWAASHGIDGDRLVEYWQTCWARTGSPAPFDRPALTEEEMRFWPQELEEYESILSKDYSALDPCDLIFVINEAQW